MEVSEQLQALTALLPGKETPLSIQQEARWALQAAGTFLRAEKPLLLSVIETRPIQPVV